MVQINQVYRVLPAFIGRDERQSVMQNGRVVYIHNRGRYAVLEFDGVTGKPREAFPLDQLTEKNRILQKKVRM